MPVHSQETMVNYYRYFAVQFILKKCHRSVTVNFITFLLAHFRRVITSTLVEDLLVICESIHFVCRLRGGCICYVSPYPFCLGR